MKHGLKDGDWWGAELEVPATAAVLDFVLSDGAQVGSNCLRGSSSSNTATMRKYLQMLVAMGSWLSDMPMCRLPKVIETAKPGLDPSECAWVRLLQGAWDNNGMADFHTPVGGAADEAELQRALESMLQVCPSRC